MSAHLILGYVVRRLVTIIIIITIIKSINAYIATYVSESQNLASYMYTKQKHLGCKKGEANQKQQLSDYRCICT